MQVKHQENPAEKKGKLLKQGVWLFYSTILWSILIVPLSVALFFMLNIASELMDDGTPEISVAMGLVVGLIISLTVGYLYSNAARKNVE